MNLAVNGRNFPKKFNGAAIQLFEALNEAGISIYINEKFLRFIESNVAYKPVTTGVFYDKLPDNIDFDMMLSVGGDGTFLETITIVYDREIPVLGINTGKLGFLATVSQDQVLSAVRQIVEKKYTLSKRFLLGCSTKQPVFEKYQFAVNEFTIQKLHTLNMIKIKISCDGEYINTYWADGIIIATPTGSTAYSMSCNGPILSPDADCFVITPIAPHNLTVRPLVIPAKSEIKLQVEGPAREILVTLDYRAKSAGSNIEFTIKKSEFQINVVNLSQNYYFSTLREKLMWGIDVRN